MIQHKNLMAAMAIFLAATLVSNVRAEEKLVADRLTKLNWLTETIQTKPAAGRKQPPVVTGVSIQPGGSLLAIVGDDHVVTLYDLTKRAFVRQLTNHRDWVRTAKFSPDGKILATAGHDRTIKFWNADSFAAAKVKSTDLDSLDVAIFEIAFSHDGKWLAAVGFDQQLRIYDVEKRKKIKTLRGPCRDMHAVAFSPNDQLIAAAGRNGIVRVWNVESEKQVTQYQVHARRVRALVFQNDQRIVSCGDDCLVNITDIANDNQTTRLARHGGKLYAIRLINELTLATAGSDNAIYIWNLENQTEMGVLKGHLGTVSCLDSANGVLISGSYDTRVRSWQFERNAKLDLTPAPRFMTPRLGSQETGSPAWRPVVK